jgi:hypothetical protein
LSPPTQVAETSFATSIDPTDAICASKVDGFLKSYARWATIKLTNARGQVNPIPSVFEELLRFSFLMSAKPTRILIVVLGMRTMATINPGVGPETSHDNVGTNRSGTAHGDRISV